MNRRVHRQAPPAAFWLWAAAVLFLTLLAGRSAVAQTIDARISREVMTLSENLQLEIILSGQVNGVGAPEGDDFRVVGQSTFSRIEIINGRQSQTNTTTLMLQPTRVGQLVVGRVPVRVGGELHYTSTFRVTVHDDGTAGAALGQPSARGPVLPAPQNLPPSPPQRAQRGAEPQAGLPQGRGALPEPLSATLFSVPLPEVHGGEPFIGASVTRNMPTAGEQIIVDYLLYTPRSAFSIDGVDLTEPEFSNAWFEDVTNQRTARGQRGRLGTQRVGNEIYNVQLLRSYAVVPLEAGEMVIPPVGLEMVVRGFAAPQEQVAIFSPSALIDVQPVPTQDRPAGFSLASVGELSASLSADKQHLLVGDSLTLTLRIQGVGLFSRFRPPSFPEIPGARVFPPEDRWNQAVATDLWLHGTRTTTVNVVPMEEGELVVPPIRVDWYDPWEKAFKSWSSEPIVIRVVGRHPSLPELELPVEEDTHEDDWRTALPAPRALPASGSSAGIQRWRGVGWAAGAPALFALVVVGASAWRRRRAAGSEQRMRDGSGREALQALGSEDPAAVLHRYLDRAWGVPSRGLTRDKLVEALSARLGHALAAQVVSALDDAEIARYGGGDSADRVEKAREAIRQMEEVRR